MKKGWIKTASVLGIAAMMVTGCAPGEKGKEKETTTKTVVEKKEPEKEKTVQKTKPVEVKGLYMSAWSMGTGRFDELLNMVNTTELNSLVIDAKEDNGYITYGKTKVATANEIGATEKPFLDKFDERMKQLKKDNVYTIARVVTFRDPLLANKKPEWAMQRKDGGGVWRDYAGMSWVDPYRKEVWDHVINIAKEAAGKGFDEIQFDYVRFPENGKKVDAEVAYHNPNNWSKQQVISEFIKYAKKELDPYGVYVSADIFGLVTSNTDDMGIGQHWESLVTNLDYVSPMTYPSHYGAGSYGLSVPDAQPYEVIKKAMTDATTRNKALEAKGKKPAIIRPWYQDFTATWVPGHIAYGPQQVQEQIRAAHELGVDQYLIWDPANTYSQAWQKN